MEKRFNIRVYGILIHDKNILVNKEVIRGRDVIKFPGGGLNWGEGTADCLVREWKEELGMNITVLDHFYTTDFFQPSAYDDSQVISIYYKVSASLPVTIVNQVRGELTYWMPCSNICADTFSLPIDKKVGELLKRLFVATAR